MRFPRPQGDAPKSGEMCTKCGALPNEPHSLTCPWRLWAEGKAA